MAHVLKLDGTLESGPSTVSDDSFPSSSAEVPLTLLNAAKAAACCTGFMRSTITSPSAYIALDGIGSDAGDTVKKGHTLFFRCKDSAVLLRLTTFGSPDVVSVVPVKGTVIIEFDDARYLKLLEVQGSGQVEWLVAGNE